MKKVAGVGFNDIPGMNSTKIYRLWNNMLQRCYNPEVHANRPTYVGCSVSDEWLYFSNFKSWAENQDWEGKHLDKDILFPGNKLYSKETCVFVEKEINLFLLDSSAVRGKYPIGVSYYKITGKFSSKCRKNGKLIHLGYFDSPDEAHEVWKKKKMEIALEYAKIQKDQRVSKALMERYK